jgi:hypothetical protein
MQTSLEMIHHLNLVAKAQGARRVMVVNGAVDLAAKVTAKRKGESFWWKNSDALAARFAKMLVWHQQRLLINCLHCQALVGLRVCR